jgi:putative membrane protein
MTKKEAAVQQPQKRILILCVDRDGDLERKAGVRTPLMGRTANMNAAVSLALSDPEEPDANAMFEAIRVTDRLQKEKKPEETFEVATICGTELGGVTADRKLVAELNTVLASFNANEVILVSDGYSDEAILPLVESRVPVSSVRRVVIKHSESIEETAALFSKYVRLLFNDPRYSRIAIGLPGLLILIFGILYIFPGYLDYYFLVIVLFLGAFLLGKGFGVDRAAKNFFKWAKEYSPPPLPIQISNYAAIAGILCIGVSVYLGIATVGAEVSPFPADLPAFIAAFPTIISWFIRGITDLMIVGIGVILFGRSIRMYFERDVKMLRNAALIVSVAWFRWILTEVTYLLINPDEYKPDNLVLAIVVGILIGIASVLAVYIIQNSTKSFFTGSKEKIDEFGES